MEKNTTFLQEGKIVITICLLQLFFASLSFCATYDVSPGSDTDCSDGKCSLQAALDASLQNNGASNIIRLAKGEYTGNFTYFPEGNNTGKLEILGGWSADFSSRTIDPVNTILNGNNSGTVLNLKVEDIDNPAIIGGNLKVEGITIKNGNGYIGGGLIALTAVPFTVDVENCIIENNHTNDAAGGCVIGVSDFISTDNGGETYLMNNIIRNNDTIFNGGGCAIISSGIAVIENNLVYGNTAENTTTDDSPDAGGLDINPIAGNYYLINNTIINNQVIARANSDSSGGGIRIDPFDSNDEALGTIHIYLYNNIIFNNSVSTNIGNDIANYINADGNLSGSSVTISHSNYTNLWNSSDAVSPILANNIYDDPKLSLESSTLYQLTSTSPCIDKGTNSASYLLETDLHGNMRKWDGNGDNTAIVDIGSYEFGSQQNVQTKFSWNLFLPAIIHR